MGAVATKSLKKLQGRYTFEIMNKSAHGFTIVELLIVIVVISILAAISIVAYNGVQNKAADSVVKSDLRQATQKTKVALVTEELPTPRELSGYADPSVASGIMNGIFSHPLQAIVRRSGIQS